MLVLVTYDVCTVSENGKQRLRRVAKECQNHGQRVQNSVFECLVDPAQWANFSKKLNDIINPETDSLRFYFLGSRWKGKIEHVGARPAYDPEGILII